MPDPLALTPESFADLLHTLDGLPAASCLQLLISLQRSGWRPALVSELWDEQRERRGVACA